MCLSLVVKFVFYCYQKRTSHLSLVLSPGILFIKREQVICYWFLVRGNCLSEENKSSAIGSKSWVIAYQKRTIHLALVLSPGILFYCLLEEKKSYVILTKS